MTPGTRNRPETTAGERPGPAVSADTGFIVNDHGSLSWHSTFSTSVDVATSTVRARGDLDRLNVNLLWGTVDVLLLAGRYHVTVDLAELTSVDTVGVTVLLALQNSLITHAGELKIINARLPVWAALDQGHVIARPPLSEQGC